jgi:hypothetical protein
MTKMTPPTTTPEGTDSMTESAVTTAPLPTITLPVVMTDLPGRIPSSTIPDMVVELDVKDLPIPAASGITEDDRDKIIKGAADAASEAITSAVDALATTKGWSKGKAAAFVKTAISMSPTEKRAWNIHRPDNPGRCPLGHYTGPAGGGKTTLAHTMGGMFDHYTVYGCDAGLSPSDLKNKATTRRSDGKPVMADSLPTAMWRKVEVSHLAHHADPDIPEETGCLLMDEFNRMSSAAASALVTMLGAAIPHPVTGAPCWLWTVNSSDDDGKVEVIHIPIHQALIIKVDNVGKEFNTRHEDDPAEWSRWHHEFVDKDNARIIPFVIDRAADGSSLTPDQIDELKELAVKADAEFCKLVEDHTFSTDFRHRSPTPRDYERAMAWATCPGVADPVDAYVEGLKDTMVMMGFNPNEKATKPDIIDRIERALEGARR